MKKFITVVAVAVLVGCIAFVFSGCGGKDENTTTTTPRTTNATTMNPGMVTDESEKGDNGVLGDIVTDVSEGMSDMVTDISEDASRMME